MLYYILRPVVKCALRLYFRRISCSGLKQIDSGGPMILLANHTASFMDAILVATFVKRRIHFFARGDVFHNKLANYLLRSLGLMPVYRLSEGRDKLQLNDTSNEEALNILARGGAVLIFAEGVSDIAKVLKPLKKGPFRLAVTAASTLPKAPSLLPLGINYTTPTKPFGTVFLNAGQPLYSDKIMLASEGNVAKAATEMMRRTAHALMPLVWDVTDREDTPLAEGLLGLLEEENPHYTFTQSQQLMRLINHTQDTSLRTDWDDYIRWQRSYPVRNGVSDKPLSALRWAGLFAGMPFAIAGFGWNFFPLVVAHDLANKKVKAPDFWAPVFVAIAVIMMLVWWAIILFIGIHSDHAGRAIIIMAIGAGCGLFYLKVYRPLAQQAAVPLRRAAYRRLNSSHASVERYRVLLKDRIRDLVSGEA